MANHLFFELFESFNKKELRQFKKFIRSPFVSHREDLSSMFTFLANNKNAGKAFPTKEILYQKAFPTQSFDDIKYRLAISSLRALMGKYLLWSSSGDDEWKTQVKMVEIFRNRNLPKNFNKTIRKVEHLQQKQRINNPDYFQYVLDTQIEQSKFYTQQKRTDELSLQEISDTLDIVYLTQKLRHACAQLSHQAVFRKNYTYGLLPYIKDEIEIEKFLKIPAVAIYYYCYRFMTEKYSFDYFQKFKQLLFEHENLFQKNEIKDLYLFAINFGIRKLNEGDDSFPKEVWTFFDKGLKAGFLLENNQLSRFTFNNIVASGIKIKAFEKVAQFIIDYETKLEISHRKSTISLNHARLEFSKKNYKKTLILLQTADFKDLINNFIAKTMLLKIYCELKEFDLLEAHLDSFSVFIRRKDVSTFHRTNYLNIIKVTKKLIRLNPFIKTEKENLKKEISKIEVLTERNWLLKQLQ